MKEARMSTELTVVCDGGEYEVSRREVLGPVWVIQVKGQYIGTFDAAEGETETQVREAACSVIRNGSTSFYEVPPTALRRDDRDRG